MKKNLISTTCWVLVILACGCQERVSFKSDVEGTVSATGTNPESKITKTTAPPEQTGSTVIAYYFHRTIRCRTCLAIETNAARVIESNFSQQITDGRLTWMPLNLDNPGSNEFEKEFDISVSTLVLAKMQDGKHTKFKKLEQVWANVSDPAKFDAYIQDEVRQFLND
jgi:hypothetical protein